jgi:hypothetical protein
VEGEGSLFWLNVPISHTLASNAVLPEHRGQEPLTQSSELEDNNESRKHSGDAPFVNENTTYSAIYPDHATLVRQQHCLVQTPLL